MQAEDQIQVFHYWQPGVIATDGMEVCRPAKQGLVAEQCSQTPAVPAAALSKNNSGERSRTDLTLQIGK